MIVPLCAKVSYLFQKMWWICDECCTITTRCVSLAEPWVQPIDGLRSFWVWSDRIMETSGKLGLGLMTNVSVEHSFVIVQCPSSQETARKTAEKAEASPCHMWSFDGGWEFTQSLQEFIMWDCRMLEDTIWSFAWVVSWVLFLTGNVLKTRGFLEAESTEKSLKTRNISVFWTGSFQDCMDSMKEKTFQQ